MLEVKNVDIAIGTRYLVKNLSFTLQRGDKLAIIGEEGNGKSTLLKVLLGICDYATRTGSVTCKGTIGYLEQTIAKEELKKYVKDYLFSSENDYYNKLNVLYKYLNILKLKDTIFLQFLNTLSGGEKIKVRILKLLLNDYDILFLDEPTNDLDIEALEWLENFIPMLDKPIVFVSHDEMLLSRTATIILHIEQIKKKLECRHTLVRMGYDAFVEERVRGINHQMQMARNEAREYKKKEEKLRQIEQKVEYQQRTISRKDPHGAQVLKKKMHSLKAQEKKLEHMQITQKPDVEEEIFFVYPKVTLPNKKVILDVFYPELWVGKKVLSKNISLKVFGKEHLCIVGKNGVGKSTLLKHFYEILRERKDIRLGYMPQNYEDILDNFLTPLLFLKSGGVITETDARAYLGNMNFTSEEMTGKIENLSNGSKAKLFLIKFVMERSQVLLLDEPTRNVSPLSSPVIRRVLRDFQGTIISVSHDRKYIEEVIDTVYQLDCNGLKKL